ncbi:hypothetical protein ACFWJ1_35660, partial [Streptomyces cinereoruber]
MPPSYRNHRYPVEVIAHCVWLYFRFPLSYREVEELMLERGVTVSYETIRRWCLKFGQSYANGLRHRRPRPGDKWHLDGCCHVIGDVVTCGQERTVAFCCSGGGGCAG